MPAKPNRKKRYLILAGGLTLALLIGVGITGIKTIADEAKPYIIVNGFAESENNYDPHVQAMRSNWVAALEAVSMQIKLDAVSEWHHNTLTSGSDINPKPTDEGTYHIDGNLYVDSETDAEASISLLNDYYKTQNYTVTPYLYPTNPTLTADENAVAAKSYNPHKTFYLTNPYSLIIGHLSAKDGKWDISITSESDPVPLSGLPKFEGNLKEDELTDPQYQEEFDDIPCPSPQNSFVGDWVPEYGCLDD